jgi:hypothetical protein
MLKLIVPVATATILALALPAHAGGPHGGGHGGYGGWHGGGGGRGRFGPAIGGAIVGGVLGGVLAYPYYSQPYYAPAQPYYYPSWHWDCGYYGQCQWVWR